ncbi:MAG: hypothetical protein M1541_19580, partial [Acidobacteria bacterium]|nr:hypothetical protein [Acidobacteriota bacterium]
MQRLVLFLLCAGLCQAQQFDGKHYRGKGDVEYLQLLDIAARMMEPDPEFQNLSMLYAPRWNGMTEGPTWNMWWIQNSYGTTYAALPLLREPFVRFIENSHELWFEQMGDSKRPGCPSIPRLNWVAPDGALCDAATPGCIIYRQGDGKADMHDWGMEFTAAGAVLKAEELLISRDEKAIARYLPMVERAVNFIETRRDPRNNLFWAGPAANLMAPSYSGYRKPDGTYDKAYLAGLSVTYIAALDRVIELEKMTGNSDKAERYSRRRELARKGLPLLMTREGYFVKSIDPDGTRHGVYGAAKHGYFETAPNHDAIAFRVVNDAQASRIYAKIASLPQLRPYGLIITNYPSLDDTYEKPEGLWRFGYWVNGGHWSTCEARMMLGYYRLGKYGDARKSMQQILTFARRFRMDNNLTNFGSEVYQPKEPINITYDAFAIPAALRRGLFEYLYRAGSLTILPHIPEGIAELQQLDPARFGSKRLYLATFGSGPVRRVQINGREWKRFTPASIELPYAEVPDDATVLIALGGGTIREVPFPVLPREDYPAAHKR